VWAIELNRFGLKLIGLWRESDEATMDSLMSDLRVVTVFIIFLSSIIPFLCALVRVWGDTLLMTENLQITVPVLVILVKLVIMRWKRTGTCTMIANLVCLTLSVCLITFLYFLNFSLMVCWITATRNTI